MQNSKPFNPTWESLKQYQVPDWFRDAKFGIFVHWGVYSVPAYGCEWYPRLMYMENEIFDPQGKPTDEWAELKVFQHHEKIWGHPSKFGYKDFVPMFRAERFDPSEWLDIFEASGAKYIVPVAEHHDGFAMYASSLTRWNSKNMGPKRDILGELAAETRRRGLHIGASSHFAFNWNYFTRKPGFDTLDPGYQDLYSRPHPDYSDCDPQFLDLWWRRSTEIIDRYKPDILWFDFYLDRPEFVPYHPRLAAYYYNRGIEWGRDLVLQSKNLDFESFPAGTNLLDLERSKMPGIYPFPWQTDTSVGENSWGYVSNWISKSPRTLINDLVDIVSKNGCLLLNVGPRADGSIPSDQIEVLKTIGDWLKNHGEGIYDTRPWKVFGEGPTEVVTGHLSEGRNKAFGSEDYRITQKGESLYVFGLGWPETGEARIQCLGKSAGNLGRAIREISLMDGDIPLTWKQENDQMVIQLPEKKRTDLAYGVKIV